MCRAIRQRASCLQAPTTMDDFRSRLDAILFTDDAAEGKAVALRLQFKRLQQR